MPHGKVQSVALDRDAIAFPEGRGHNANYGYSQQSTGATAIPLLA